MRDMFEQEFKNIDNILKSDNAGGAMDYIEQTSWIIFLKYLEDLEIEREKEAKLSGKKYNFILSSEYRWNSWACPLGKDGKVDYNKALTGKDLINFVDQKLFPYLRKFRSENTNTIEYKIGEIFNELKNKIKSGYALRDILNTVNGLEFQSSKNKHELSHLYESKIAKMGNAGRDGGQYYTPRPLIKTIVKLIDPKIGETIYDGACGSCGFLIESFNYLTKEREKLSSKEWKTLQEKTFYGKEKITLPYIIGVMNMILHGIDAPNIIHTNTLSENLADIQEKDRFDIVLANPPFGGKERKEVQQNFPIKSGETAYLFLQHFMKKLKAGGRAGIVIKNTFLSEDSALNLRKELLNTCDLHTILELPSGVFQAGVKTVILFFKKGSPTKKIWFYQLNLDRNLGKTNPLNEKDLTKFAELYKTRKDSDNSWTIDVKDINQKLFDLSAKNPNKKDNSILRDPEDILKKIKTSDKKIEIILDKIFIKISNKNYKTEKLGNVCDVIAGQSPEGKFYNKLGNGLPFYQGKKEFTEKFIGIPTTWTTKVTKEAQYGDILMSVRAPVGPINFATQKMCIGRGLAAIRVTKNINKDFLFYFLQNFKSKLIGNAGAVFNSINKSQIEDIEIPLPSITEQEHIVKKLDQISEQTKKLEEIYKNKIEDIEELKKSILNKTFSKKL